MRHSLGKLGIPPMALLVILLALAMACGAAAPADQPPAPAVTDPGQPPVAEPAPTAAPPPVAAPQVDRLVYAAAGFPETNRFWTNTRPEQQQNDPYMETLVEVDPHTAAFTPRLAESWEMNSDATRWTFNLRQGVQFHRGFGEMTGHDVELARSLHEREETVSTFGGVWRGGVFEVVDNHQIVFVTPGPNIGLDYPASRSGDLRVVSKAQFDSEGLEGYDRLPVGTGYYQMVERRAGQFIRYDRFDDHWSGQPPDFREMEFRIVPESSTRAAMLVAGEAHMASITVDQTVEAVRRGMKVLESQVPTDWTDFIMGGLHFVPGDPAFDSGVPWTDIRVRQALNMAIDRDELRELFWSGPSTSPTYVSAFHPIYEGYNPEWEQRFPEMYGYNPGQARELLAEAGYPAGALKMPLHTYTGATAGGLENSEIVEVVALYFTAVGVDVEIVETEQATIAPMYRAKEYGCCVRIGNTSIRPIQERIRQAHYSKGNTHTYGSQFVEDKYEELTRTFDAADRERVAREIGDHLFENFATIPLFYGAPSIVVNPTVIAEWIFPGAGAGRFTHFHMIKAVR